MDLLEKILGILSGLGFVAGMVTKVLERDAESYVFWALAALSLIVILFVWRIKRNNHSNNSNVINLATLHCDLGWRKKKYNQDFDNMADGRANGGIRLELRRSILSYENKSGTSIGHRKEFEVTALVNAVRDFTDRYQYSNDRFDTSATGICKLTAPEKRQSITNIERREGWIFYTVHRNDALPQNKKGCFVMEMNPIPDPCHKTEPFLSTGIYEPTKRLELVLNFPPSLNLKNPRVRIFNSYSAETEFTTILPSNDPEHFVCDYEHGQFSYKIDYPVYTYKYRIDWDFIP